MSSETFNYLDGNAAAGELGKVFATDVTTAQGRCANCGAVRRFAEAHLYIRGPGVVARCSECRHVLLRLASCGESVFLDVKGLTYLRLDARRFDPTGDRK